MLLFIVLIAGTLVASEQLSTLAGVITGPDGARLPGAIVTARLEGGKSSSTAVTNSSGMYNIPDLHAGTYQLVAELPGFELAVSPVFEIASGANKVMDMSLEISTIRLAVNVVGFAPRDSIEAAEICESSARDVGEALTHTPGVWKVRKGGIANDIVLRGFQGKDLNILIDGQRVYGACPNNMDPQAFHVDFAEVDRIEIGKGSFDIKSQGSLGGTINIVTRDAEKGFHAAGNLSTGSYGLFNPAATASYGRDEFSILGGYSYRLSSPYKDGSGKRFTEYVNYHPSGLDSDAFRAGTVWGKASFSLLAGHLAQVSYTRQEADHVLYPYLLMDAVYDDTDRMGAAYQIADIAGPFRALKIHGYYTRVKHWMTDEYRTSSISFPREYSMGTWAGTKAFGMKIETAISDFTLGFEAYRREWTATTRMAGMSYAPQYSIPDARAGDVGVYLQYDKPISENIRLNLGGRIDTLTTSVDGTKANTDLYYAYNSTRSISHTNNYPSGTVHLSYKIPFGIELHGGVGHTVRVPDARERYFALKRKGADWVGNPKLEPSRNTGMDAGISFRLPNLLLEGNWFLNYVNNYIAVIPLGKSNPLPGIMNSNARSYRNVNVRIYGAEFLVSYLFTRNIFLSGDLSYVRGTRDVDPEKGILTPDMAEIPPVRSRASLRYDTARFSAEIEAIFSGAQDHVDAMLGEQRTAGYGIANLRGGINFNRLRIHIALNNLFGRSYFEHLSYQRDPFRSGARVYEPGRNFFVNISYRY